LKLTLGVRINRGMRNVSSCLHVISHSYLTGPIPSLPSPLAVGKGTMGLMEGRNGMLNLPRDND
jgi:hypothetical protein